MGLRATTFAHGVVLASLLAACGTSSLFSGGKSNKDDGRRPSEQGEGVVGYLKDPSQVEYQRTDGQVVVKGLAGAVLRGEAPVGGLPVCLQQIAAADLKSLLSARSKFGGAVVKTLALGAAKADGSFSLSTSEANLDAAKLLSINVTGQCTAEGGESELFASRTSVVFKDLSGNTPFNGGDVLYPEYAGAWESPTNEPPEPEPPLPPKPFFCTAKAPECPMALKLDVADSITQDPITSYVVTFYDLSCAPDAKGCKPNEIASLVFSGETPYYPNGSYYFNVSAKGYNDFNGKVDEGQLYNGEILLKPL